MFDVYLITDTGAPSAVLRTVELALGERDWAGRVGLQMRAKDLSDREARELGQALRRVTRARGVPLLVNTRLELARELRADGVHLPERGPSAAYARTLLGLDALIGVSRHDATGLTRARAEGANLVTLSPVFATQDKGTPLGLDGFRAIAASAGAGLPVFALGGVRPRDVDGLVAAGACGVAAIGAVMRAADPHDALARLVDLVADARCPNLDTLNRERGPLPRVDS